MGTASRMTPTAGLLVAGLLSISAVHAESVGDFYRGKTIQVVIGYGPGGGYDIYGRLAAQFLGRHIPGNPTLVPVNMPGNSSLRAVDYLIKVAPKDGTYLGSVQQSLSMTAIIRGGHQFDPTLLPYIGRFTSNIDIGVALPKTGLKSFDDLRKRDVTVGTDQAGSMSVAYAKTLNAYAGTKLKIITGYTGSNEIQLAAERGEVEVNGSYSLPAVLLSHPDWVNDGKATILYQNALKRFAKLPNTPTLLDVVKGEEGREIARVIAGTAEIGRSILTTPGVPPERLAALRKAFEAMLDDPDFKAACMQRRSDDRSGEGRGTRCHQPRGDEHAAAGGGCVAGPYEKVERSRNWLHTIMMEDAMLKEIHHDKPFHWPKGYRTAVTMTFDFQGGEDVRPLEDGKIDHEEYTQCEYGPHTAIWRILRILDEENVKATFNTCGGIAERYPEAVKAVVDRGHEIAGHGYHHETARDLTRDQEHDVMLRTGAMIKQRTGHQPIGWRSCTQSPNSIELLMDHGYLWNSNSFSHDLPFIWEANGKHLIELPRQPFGDGRTYAHRNNDAGNPQDTLRIWKSMFDCFHGESQYGGTYVPFQFHPYISGRPGRDATLRSIIQHMKSAEGTWITTATEVAQWCRDEIFKLDKGNNAEMAKAS